MVKILSILLFLGLSGCATVPDSVKIALEKEGTAISAVESDYNISVNRYHAELINQIDARLDDIFRYEIEMIETSGRKLTANDVMKLENARAVERISLVDQAEKEKQKYLNSHNLEILKALHAKVLQYAASDKFTASDFATVLTELDAGIDKIKKDKQEQLNPKEGD